MRERKHDVAGVIATLLYWKVAQEGGETSGSWRFPKMWWTELLGD